MSMRHVKQTSFPHPATINLSFKLLLELSGVARMLLCYPTSTQVLYADQERPRSSLIPKRLPGLGTWKLWDMSFPPFLVLSLMAFGSQILPKPTVQYGLFDCHYVTETTCWITPLHLSRARLDLYRVSSTLYNPAVDLFVAPTGAAIPWFRNDSKWFQNACKPEVPYVGFPYQRGQLGRKGENPTNIVISYYVHNIYTAMSILLV
ncbi:uncharacterized protein MCYG_05214 [Microsporum canis CBS 113480]|uniref:Uncharacterized protein n=1 Tax=Arthroderma otae (strain ATCC MYA-4605 / CBS 113480) TaxID=554155 RepID=C5FR92_ARTOC|nr:uncharacterized protein MCYG_05214 [Microsporum canis CBS 113480]EEQ32395.1 predicted protein [Microsporum canis CBS 113480]